MLHLNTAVQLSEYQDLAAQFQLNPQTVVGEPRWLSFQYQLRSGDAPSTCVLIPAKTSALVARALACYVPV